MLWILIFDEHAVEKHTFMWTATWGNILTCNSCDDKNYPSGKYDKICIKMLFDQKSHQV